MNFLLNIGVLVLFALLILYGAKYRPIQTNEDYFYRLNHMRGIFALEIVIGHVVRYVPSILYPLGKMMIVSVAFYFFVSAYGLSRSFYQKEHYLRTFPRQKFPYLIIISLISYAFTCLMEFLTGIPIGYLPESVKEIPKMYLLRTNWYIWEILLWYLLFFIAYRYLKGTAKIIFMSLFGTAAGIFFFYRGFPQEWYSSILAFPLGLAFFEYKERILAFFKKLPGKITTVLLAVLGICSLFLPPDSLTGMFFLRNILCIAGIILLFYFSSYIQIGNRITKFLGSISTEIYLFQFPWLRLTQSMESQYLLRLLIVTVCTLLSAVVFHAVNQMIKKHFLK